MNFRTLIGSPGIAPGSSVYRTDVLTFLLRAGYAPGGICTHSLPLDRRVFTYMNFRGLSGLLTLRVSYT